MKLNLQKRIAAQALKCSPHRVCFDVDRLPEIKESITKADIRSIIKKGLITEIPARGISKGRLRKFNKQKKKGRRRGLGSRKGRATARNNSKQRWMNSIRAQRSFLKELKSKSLVSIADFHMLYRKAKGGFFRSVSHIKLHMKEHDIFIKK